MWQSLPLKFNRKQAQYFEDFKHGDIEKVNESIFGVSHDSKNLHTRLHNTVFNDAIYCMISCSGGFQIEILYELATAVTKQ